MKKKVLKKAPQKKKKPAKKKAARAKKTVAVKPRKASKRPARVLSAGEQPPFRIENPKGKGLGLIICDHASNRIPRALKDLGVKKADIKKHIGWDIGAEDITLHIARALDMPAVLATYSRLVLDLNRAPHHAECIMESSDHIKIPANIGLSKGDREKRVKEIYWPYQNKIGKQLDVFAKRRQTPIVMAIHTLTPEMDGVKRPWHISILWNREEKIAKSIVKEIRTHHPDLLIGENEPYTLFSPRFPGSTMQRHAEERNLPYVFVEFRQDLVDTKEKAAHWANLFLEAMRPVLENTGAYQAKPRKK